MLSTAAAGLHAGLIERAQPVLRPAAILVSLVSPAPVASASASPPVPRHRHALTVRVEPDLRAALEAEKARLGTTAQAILHRALREHLGR